jgi:AraC-like DNA-binding protein
MNAHAGTDVIRAWKPPIAGVREVFHARFREHRYPPHVHDVWTVFVVDDGAIRYDLDRHDRAATLHGVSVLPPHVVHDGRPATDAGFVKRVLYLEAEAIGEHLIGRAVDKPELRDEDLRRQVSRLHEALECFDDRLEAETRLAFVTERIRGRLGDAKEDGPLRPDLVEAFRAYLDTHLFDPVTIRAAAEELGASPTQIARAFSSTLGIPPHAYVLGRRLEAARDRILRGQPLADVAADVGFVDQAHLSRRFRQFLGATPGQFRRANLPA